MQIRLEPSELEKCGGRSAAVVRDFAIVGDVYGYAQGYGNELVAQCDMVHPPVSSASIRWDGNFGVPLYSIVQR